METEETSPLVMREMQHALVMRGDVVKCYRAASVKVISYVFCDLNAVTFIASITAGKVACLIPPNTNEPLSSVIEYLPAFNLVFGLKGSTVTDGGWEIG